MIKSSAHRAPRSGSRHSTGGNARAQQAGGAPRSHVPRETQRGVSAVEVASQARSMLLLVSDKGEIELGESRSSRQGPAHAPRPA